MSVRAKFYCASKSERAFSGSPHKQESVTLQPVINGSEENKRFFQYTPGGKLELDIMNPAAAAQFEVGKEYLVDFTPADQPLSEPVENDALKKLAEVTLKAVAEISCPDKKQEILDAMADVVK